MSFSYAAVGATASGGIPPGFRSDDASAVIGSGDAFWRFASHEVLRWGIKTRSGFGVRRVDPPRSDADPVVVGDTVTLSIGPFREPVGIVYVVDEPDRVGFAYGTLPGHPLRGEEAFVVSRDASGVVRLDIRSFSRPASLGWRLAYPALRIAQRRAHGRYLLALQRGR